jgi:topoisomerase-4 subunit B
LDPVKIDANESLKEMLKFFMGKNTPTRQEYIIRNLRFEHDILDEDEEGEENGKPILPKKSKKTEASKTDMVESAAA